MNKGFFLKNIGKSIILITGYLYPFPWIENIYVKSGKRENKYPPIFILGAPRSGTTLIYQLLIQHYNLSYISNFASVFFKFPSLITALFKRKHLNNINFELKSNYGVIPGLWSPSEASKVFYYWFENSNNLKFIGRRINKISEIFGAPFICKNLDNCFRLEKIIETFPKAIFIYVKRELLYNTQSLLYAIAEAIKKISARPSVLNNNTNKTLLERSLDDIVSVNNMIEEFFSERKHKVLKISYESFCDNYLFFINEFKVFYEKSNLKLERKHFQKVNLKASRIKKLDDEQWNILVDLIDKSK